MRVLLTHAYFLEEDIVEAGIQKPYAPLGLLYISSWLEKHGTQNDVYDTTFKTKAKLKKYLLDTAPEIIGLYANLMTKINCIEIMEFINKKLPHSIIVIGGPDVRYNAFDYLKNGASVAVIGEGEETMREIVESARHGLRTEFGHIDGLAYLSEGELVRTAERNRIRPIDDLPLPNRKKINLQEYLDLWKINHGKSALTVSTQRGCPYTCKWCSTAVYGQSYRRRSPELVVLELKSIVEEYKPDSIWFVDDVFTVSHKWIEEFVAAIKKHNVYIPFECISRADRMNEQVIDWLVEAGCFRIWIGAESGSQKVIDLMDRRVDVNQVRKMIQLSQKKGLEAGTFLMLGYPGETEEDIKKTLNYLKSARPKHFTITIAYPIKGTPLYNEVELLPNKNLSWENSTDRQLDFVRSYSRKYYDYAIKWIVNEMKALNNKSLNQRIFIESFLKSKLARLAMYLYK